MNMNAILGSLKHAVAGVTIDIETAEAEKAALETSIRMLKRERQRLEAELTRELAAAGKTPLPTSIMLAATIVKVSDVGGLRAGD